MHAVVEMCVFYYCAVNWRNKVDIYSDRHNAQMLFNTYEDRAIVAEYIRKSGRNVHCRGRGTISSWNHAVTPRQYRTERTCVEQKDQSDCRLRRLTVTTVTVE